MNINLIRNNLKRIALLDAILCQEWQYRYYSYNSNWSPSEEMASMRNGCGDEWFFLFKKVGKTAAFKIFSKDIGAKLLSADISDKYKIMYYDFLNEPAFTITNCTQLSFLDDNQLISYGKDVFDPIPPIDVANYKVQDYFKWAEQYYEITISKQLQIELWETPNDINVVKIINPDIIESQYNSDVLDIQYNAQQGDAPEPATNADPASPSSTSPAR